MVKVFKITNPHNPQDGIEETKHPGGLSLLEAGEAFYDEPWVCLAFIGGKQYYPLREEWADITLKDGDLVYFIPKVGATVLVIVAIIVAVVAVALALSVLPPDISDSPEPDPVFGLTGQKNQNRLNNPIEDSYGRNRLWPSYGTRAYNQYYGNDQFQFQLFCIGQGSYDIEQVYIEDTEIENFQETEFEIYQPGEPVTLFPDNVVTSAEVGDLELYGPNEPEYQGYSGPFVANDTQTTTTRLEVDVQLPQGSYYSNKEGGLNSRTAAASFEYREIDNNGDPVGSWQTLKNFSVTLRTNTPQRYTYFKVVPAGRYEVRAVRTNNKDTSHRAGNTLKWVGLRAFLPSTKDYGDITMLALKARASNNLNDSSSNKINVVATRKLPIYDGVTMPDFDDYGARVATTNPVWALVNILRAPYGGNLTDEYIDLDFLLTEATEAGTQGIEFNWVYDQKSTVWESVKLPAYVFKAVPMLNGSRVTIVRDKPDQMPTFFINPENTISGSFKLEKKLYDLNENDALEVEYMDAETWKNETVTCKLSGQNGFYPKKLQLKGVTNRQKAYDLGMYLWAKENYERQQVSVKTGLEAYIPTFGDTVRVGSNIPRWGQSGHVTGVDGNVVTLSENAEFQEGSVHQLAIRGRYGQELGPYTVIAGESLSEVIITDGTIPPGETYFDYNREPPYFIFGVANYVGRICRIADLRPSEEEVTIKATVDDQRRFLDYGTAPERGADTDLPGVSPTPIVSNVEVYQVPGSIELVTVTWAPAAGALNYTLEQPDDGISWTPVNDTITTTNYTLTVTPEQTLYVRVAGVNAGIGPWATWDGVVGVPTGEAYDVDGLVVSPAFTGTSCRIEWEAAIYAESYEIRVLTDSVLRITANTTETSFVVSYEELAAIGGLNREIVFAVYGKNEFGLSPIAAGVTAINPAPAQLTGMGSTIISDTGSIQTIQVNWAPSPETDIAFYRVWGSNESGFTVGPDTVLYEGANTEISVQIGNDGEGYPDLYWRVAAVDVWGDETNPTDEQIFTDSDPLGVSFDPPATGYPAGDYPLSVTINKENPGATIRWSKSAMPQNRNDGNEYTGPVSVSADETLYARAFTGALLGGPGTTGLYDTLVRRAVIGGEIRETIQGDERQVIV